VISVAGCVTSTMVAVVTGAEALVARAGVLKVAGEAWNKIGRGGGRSGMRLLSQSPTAALARFFGTST
jgi:hypothetical protein